MPEPSAHRTSTRHPAQELPNTSCAESAAPADGTADRRPIRYLTGTDGRRWTVKERVDSFGDAAHPLRTLIADAGWVIRRIWAYPADWATCDAAALLNLLEGPPAMPR